MAKKKAKPVVREPTSPPEMGSDPAESEVATSAPPPPKTPTPGPPAFPGGVTLENLDWVFTYHAPTEDQRERYGLIAAASKNLARVILEVCPQCADRTAAIRKVREAKMTANAAIATHGSV